MKIVAPHAGAWIEIHCAPQRLPRRHVAPHAGAWIEIYYVPKEKADAIGRSPCGSVD